MPPSLFELQIQLAQFGKQLLVRRCRTHVQMTQASGSLPCLCTNKKPSTLRVTRDSSRGRTTVDWKVIGLHGPPSVYLARPCVRYRRAAMGTYTRCLSRARFIFRRRRLAACALSTGGIKRCHQLPGSAWSNLDEVIIQTTSTCLPHRTYSASLQSLVSGKGITHAGPMNARLASGYRRFCESGIRQTRDTLEKKRSQ